MSNSGSGARLTALTKQLEEQWRQTRQSWTDAKADEFEERFMRELETVANVTCAGIDNLEQILRNLRTECE
jgi:UTP:GlnB (protein PII) uridylyltransferase